MSSNAYFVTEAEDDPNLSDEILEMNNVEFQMRVARHSARLQNYMVTVHIQVWETYGYFIISENTFDLSRQMYDNCHDVIWNHLVAAAAFDTWHRLLVSAVAPEGWPGNNGYPPHNPHELFTHAYFPRLYRYQPTQSLEQTRLSVNDFARDSILWISEPREQVEDAFENRWDNIQPFIWTFKIYKTRESMRDESQGHAQALEP
jgi:hypothetical protein